jgi:uncharacterized protein DUF4185
MDGVQTQWSRFAGPAVLGIAVVLAASGFALLAARSLRSSAAGSQAGASATASSARTKRQILPGAPQFVCSFSNADATAAQVQGADGGQSVVVGGRAYWLFGDTLLLPSSGRQIEANTMASSASAPGAGCPKLTYLAQNRTAMPFLEKDGSLTVWPAGAFAVDDHSFDLFTVYVYGSGPYAYSIGEVGVARFDTTTMTATVLSRSLWTAASGFEDPVISADPADVVDGKLRVILQTRAGDHLLARVPVADIADVTKYEYWDGGGWSKAPSAAEPMWPHPHETDPIARLGSFESGGSIAYNDYVGAFVAVVSDGIDKIAVRTASRLEGPWSAPTTVIDCAPIAQPAVPVCYSPSQHPQLAADGGRSLFITFTRMSTYDVVAYRVDLGPK